MSDTLPFVSIVVPCRNEQRFIGECLASILATDYPADRFEVLVVDGMSTDGTRDAVRETAHRAAQVRLIDNPAHITPVALNLGIGAARGDLVAWMSAHNRYQPDYLRQCVSALLTYDADNAGGGIVTVARGRGAWATAVVTALSHPFGVGNSQFRTAAGAGAPRWVDTVFGGCYRREVFERVGLFNEALVRGQDMEFNLRMRRAGCRTLFVPGVTSEYFARTEPAEFVRHTFTNGVWAILPFAASDGAPVSWRHLVPLAFVLALVAFAVTGVLAPVGWWPLGGVVGLYATMALSVATHASLRAHDPRLLALLPVALFVLHVSYGLGSLWGLVRLVADRRLWRTPKVAGQNSDMTSRNMVSDTALRPEDRQR